MDFFFGFETEVKISGLLENYFFNETFAFSIENFHKNTTAKVVLLSSKYDMKYLSFCTSILGM